VISFLQPAGSRSASLLAHLRMPLNIILLIIIPKNLTNTTPAIYSGFQKYVPIDLANYFTVMA
jgi:hypothetical protein